jgi:hypothetical protein
VAYATIDDLTAYSEGIDVSDAALVGRELERASRDVDNYVGGAWPLLDSGWRFDPADPLTPLTDGQIDALVRATCAQAEFRLYKGPEYFKDDMPGIVQGPDFTIDEGTRRWFSGKAARELRVFGLTVTGARAVP